MKRRVFSLLAATLLVGAVPAHATTVGIPDSDSATLMALLLQAVKDSAQAGQILATTQEALKTAQQTTEVLTSMTEVYVEAKHIIENPNDLFDASKAAFAKTFPELQAIEKDAQRLQASFSGSSTARLNPFALQELIRNSQAAGDSAYQTLVMMDESVYGLTKEHLAAQKVSNDLAEANQARRHLLDSAQLTQQGFIAQTAKAAADTAVATAMSASGLQELVRLQKLEQLKAYDAAAGAAASMDTELQGLGAAAGIDPSLDPRKDIAGDVPSGGLQ